MLLKVRGNAEVLNSIATALPKIWQDSPLSLIHASLQQRLVMSYYTSLRSLFKIDFLPSFHVCHNLFDKWQD